MDRRRFLQGGAGALGTALGVPAHAAATGPPVAGPVLERPIARSGERVPAVGLGTWITFNVGARDEETLARRRAVLERFFAGAAG